MMNSVKFYDQKDNLQKKAMDMSRGGGQKQVGPGCGPVQGPASSQHAPGLMPYVAYVL